ncbi:MAG: membrane protein insertion efficiency factor YidD [Clostridia bacterium]|nr:membrane protein insertion efficiency factor YidD [Clostridia bacterium]
MKKILKFFIKLYRKFLSPILPQSCRFEPSCSQYALEALDKHGVIKGTILSVYRVLRCNPFCRGGYDPVPDKFTFKRQELKAVEQEENTGENNV